MREAPRESAWRVPVRVLERELSVVRPAPRTNLPRLAALLLVTSAPLAAQTSWNSPEALEAVARARAVRQSLRVDSTFLSYRAEARGYVYFFLDRPGVEERSLVKADQIALDLFWQAPDVTRQRIVGLRDEKLLPTNVRYHLDHLTVVQDEFADVMRLGDGDEVQSVVHPAAPGSEDVYDFLIADSLTISFPETDVDSVTVYELQVRPKDLSRPGFLGSLFLDRRAGAIVRMSFTFTPASYVDRSLDYIRISLDNALWEGRYWLPYRQEAEVRRELPEIDFLGGSVIRGRFQIGSYEFNLDVPESVLQGGRVSTAPAAERLSFPFETALFEHLDDEGLSPPPSLEEIRKQARQMVSDRYLSGLRQLRLYLPSTSQALRYDRAEGVFSGVGLVLRPSSAYAVRTHLGYAFSRRSAAGFVEIGAGDRANAPWIRLYVNDLRDLGPIAGASGLVNSLSALTSKDDYLDPFFSSGVRVTPPGWSGPVEVAGAIVLERHRSASLVVDDEESRFRPVRSVEEGDLLSAQVRGRLGPEGGDWELETTTAYSSFEGRSYGELGIRATWSREDAWSDLSFGSEARAGWVGASAPQQALYLLGGRETLLGHAYRGFIGDRFWLVEARLGRTLVTPWVNARAFAAAGWAGLSDRDVPTGWDGEGDAGAKVSVGLGLGLAWDVLHVDLGRGLGGGGWALAVTSTERFRGWL